MRSSTYDSKTVSVTINSDLYRQAKGLGIDTSQVAEEALAEDIKEDLQALDAYEAEHGSFAEMVREHYRATGADEPNS